MQSYRNFHHVVGKLSLVKDMCCFGWKCIEIDRKMPNFHTKTSVKRNSTCRFLWNFLNVFKVYETKFGKNMKTFHHAYFCKGVGVNLKAGIEGTAFVIIICCSTPFSYSDATVFNIWNQCPICFISVVQMDLVSICFLLPVCLQCKSAGPQREQFDDTQHLCGRSLLAERRQTGQRIIWNSKYMIHM